MRHEWRRVIALVSFVLSANATLLWTNTFPPTSGPIEGATCNVEDLEEANDSQLHSILEHLVETSFFKNFVVDLDESCPISTWHTKKPKAAKEPKKSTTKMEEAPQEDEGFCTGLPDMDPDAKPACSVDGEQDTLSPWQTSNSIASAFSSLKDDPTLESTTQQASPKGETERQEEPENEQDYSFECGGTEEEEENDLDEPLCTLTEEERIATPFRDFITSAFKSLSFGRWESESQMKTFSWSQKTDNVVLESQNCNDDLPDSFWVDMCSNITVGKGSKVVNLRKNPERNTGYNGTHIWNAIYRENCIVDTADSCYEEQVLYRLLSGLHTSTTLSIAKNYYAPSKRKGRENWEPNPSYFMEKFEHHPEYLRNLHFSYVVLLRALRKASPFLEKYKIQTGNIVEDETATILLKRLLDSAILNSCQSVFSAFDESVMFQKENAESLKGNFKGVFHNVSSILDCVQCQQCKLHGKMAMLGYGTALKILFLSENRLASSLERNEIVAFINTIAKFSNSMREIRELTSEYWQVGDVRPPPLSISDQHEVITGPSLPPAINVSDDDSIALVDTAIGLVASLSREGHLDSDRETELVQMAFARHPDVLILAKHYGADMEKFLTMSRFVGSHDIHEPDAIIVGSGLAGLSAALNILDRGGKVVIIEKEHLLGGNSNKASSGINACCPNNETYGDYLESFKEDTIRSAGESARPELIEVLISNSHEAVTWLKERVGVDLSLRAQLGGHSHKRTHRPSNGMAGAEIIYAMQKAVRAYEESGRVEILVDTRVTRLLTDDNGRVYGVEYQTAGESGTKEMTTANVVLATGGFAADRSSDSYLSKHRPELMGMAATAGPFSTGDGISLATSLGAGTVDMDKVQVHPTGWVDPKDPTNPSKILAAELMRGVGGILINSEGNRFCNELGTRAYVTDQMLSHDPYYAKEKKWNKNSEVPTFSLVLSSSAAQAGKKHVDLYTHKGLLHRLEGLKALAEFMGQDEDKIRSTLVQYQQDASYGKDEFGKTSFRGVPATDLDNEIFFAGIVTPVLHYCMGGITIDTEGNVLDENGHKIQGLHAAGEVTGGVHGDNRLGGNSLLECTVFGTIVGKKLPIRARNDSRSPVPPPEEAKRKELRDVSTAELQRHNTPQDCWVAIGGMVYDLTDFADEHPAGAKSIHDLAGTDGTAAFEAVHSAGLLNEFEEDRIGPLVVASAHSPENSPRDRTVSITELQRHNTTDDCWVAFHGDVFDMTEFAKQHPGGSHLIQDLAGSDGTDRFQSIHKKGKLRLVEEDRVGTLVKT
jgi:flavocytochrome c